MTELEKAQRRMELITEAIAAVKFAANEERKILHSAHIDMDYQDALNHLDLKLTGVRAYLSRIETIGR